MSNQKKMKQSEVKISAEQYVTEHPYPGLYQLAGIIGCAPMTLRLAMKDSKKLIFARRQFDHPLMVRAEEYISENGYPGLEELAKELGCLPKSLRRVLRSSEKLIVEPRCDTIREMLNYSYGHVRLKTLGDEIPTTAVIHNGED